jgi:DNA repair protein RecO (recombination protein O)
MAPPRVFRTETVVLRRHDFGEADRVLTLYTANAGKIRAIAKGIRRPTSRLGGHLELFTHSNLMIARGRNLDVITQVDSIDTFASLREDLWRTGLAYYASELVDRLTEERGENAALFNALVTAYRRLTDGARPIDALHHFEAQALAELGFRPELRVCVRCRAPLQPIQNSFSATSGGILCPNCRGTDPLARPISANGLKVLRLCLDDDWPTTLRLRLDTSLNTEVEQTLRSYTQYVAESRLKSAEFVETLRRSGLATSVPGTRSAAG